MNEYRKSSILRYQLVFVFLGFAFCLALVMNVNTGSVDISPFEIFRIIFSGDRSDFVGSSIIWKIRLPRLLSAAVMGGALSVSGFLLQTFFRNPIAGPFVLGISSGAKMFVGFVLLLLIPHTKQVSPYIQVAAAFVGSMLSMGFVMLMSRKVRNMSMLLVAGIMISYICSAVTDLCVTFAKEADIANLTSWSMGSFGSITWDNLKIASIIILFASMTSFFISKPIEAYQLGEGYAQNMGVSIRAFRIVLILCSSLLSACVTAFAGAYIVRWHSGSTYNQDALENCQTDCGDTYYVSVRGCVLYVLRSFGTYTLLTGGTGYKHGYICVRGPHSGLAYAFERETGVKL